MFRKGARVRFPRWSLIVAVLAFMVIAFELYSIIVPFQSNNPLWTQVTIGQPVIDNWTYGGQDEEGYLRFYNRGESIVLPPSAKLFSADGQFVIIEGFSPSSLTYAYPFEAVPMSWLVAGGAVVVAGGWLLWRRKSRIRVGSGGFRSHKPGSGLRLPKVPTYQTSGKRWTRRKNSRFRSRPVRKPHFRR